MQSISKTFYHGTSSEWLIAISREGLVPCRSVGCDQWARRRKWRYTAEDAPVRAPSVFLSEGPDRAKDYALIARALYPGTLAVLLEVTVPEGIELHRDELDKIAWRYEGVIPPNWIGKRTVVPGLKVK